MPARRGASSIPRRLARSPGAAGPRSQGWAPSAAGEGAGRRAGVIARWAHRRGSEERAGILQGSNGRDDGGRRGGRGVARGAALARRRFGGVLVNRSRRLPPGTDDAALGEVRGVRGASVPRDDVRVRGEGRRGLPEQGRRRGAGQQVLRRRRAGGSIRRGCHAGVLLDRGRARVLQVHDATERTGGGVGEDGATRG